MNENFEMVLFDYNQSWPLEYLKEVGAINENLGFDGIVDIQHFGSTSIPGLAAKPIIDILVGFTEFDVAVKKINSLISLGYEYVEGVSVPGGRLFFKKNPRTHHLHFVEYNTEHWNNPIKFRDYLRVHDKERKEYEELKKRSSEIYKYDRVSYGNSKTSFVTDIISKANLAGTTLS